jgi:hypothetical protein
MRAVEVEFETVRLAMQRLLDNATIFDRAGHIAKTNLDPSSLLNDFYEEHLE